MGLLACVRAAIAAAISSRLHALSIWSDGHTIRGYQVHLLPRERVVAIQGDYCHWDGRVVHAVRSRT